MIWSGKPHVQFSERNYPTLARTMREGEGARSLLCYKHVV